ncbi:lanthionine synthetase C family protein [Hamadaea tsunoensis]|uniref:lanthionine synthetase C family protein n=1 Tax=Hamadaea tsunoensis TaxID=53368 RepID=UPI000685607C|nr:lanthionine synthetase C family protein [Hamadaea tsunoensis]
MSTPTAAPVAFDGPDALRQSLASGAPGIALASLERACADPAARLLAHQHIQAAVSGPIDGGPHTGLFYGAPALAFLLHCAATFDERYRPAAARLDPHVLRIAQTKLTDAAARTRSGDPAPLHEFDLFYGLTGIGALMLRRLPGSDAFADVLRYLVALTRPGVRDDVPRPGWWTAENPDPTMPTPGGHANLGMAHGAAGILALLALAMRHGHVVDDHAEAIERLTDWFARWRQETPDGRTWWPQWLTAEELHTGRVDQTPGRASWCYGTPGIARALHLAATATGNPTRSADAETVLLQCLTRYDVDWPTDAGLCHGLAGVYQTVYRAAEDAPRSALAGRLPALAAGLHTTAAAGPAVAEPGLLNGSAGILLAAETATNGYVHSGWDVCLLIV